MKQVKLLDCTLRDGGYVNDWEFGHDNTSDQRGRGHSGSWFPG